MTLSSLVPASSTYLVNNKVIVNLLAVRLQITDDWADLLGGAESDTAVKEMVTWAIDLEGRGMIALFKGKRTAFPDRTAGEGQKWWWLWPSDLELGILWSQLGHFLLSQFSSTFYFRHTESWDSSTEFPCALPYTVISHMVHLSQLAILMGYSIENILL